MYVGRGSAVKRTREWLKREKEEERNLPMERWETCSRVSHNAATTHRLDNFPPYLPPTRIIIHLFLKDTLSTKNKYHIPDISSNKRRVIINRVSDS